MPLNPLPSNPERNGTRAGLRRALLQRRAQMSTHHRSSAEQALTVRLAQWVRSQFSTLSGRRIAVYWPIRGEPDLRLLWDAWSSAGAVLALPVVDAVAQPLRFVRWIPGEGMRTGKYGISEPTGLDCLDPELIVVPCVGFDSRAFRLGYGGGYYDRTLATFAKHRRSRPRIVGIAWDEARLEGFETEPTDLPLDAVISPSALVEPVRGASGMQSESRRPVE